MFSGTVSYEKRTNGFDVSYYDNCIIFEREDHKS